MIFRKEQKTKRLNPEIDLALAVLEVIVVEGSEVSVIEMAEITGTCHKYISDVLKRGLQELRMKLSKEELDILELLTERNNREGHLWRL